MLTVEHVRQTAAKFCSDRSWEQFHKPTSIALALAGFVSSKFDHKPVFNHFKQVNVEKCAKYSNGSTPWRQKWREAMFPVFHLEK